MLLLPDGVVSSTEVDEEIPAPVPHGQQVGHAAKIHGEQAGTTPDGGHAPGCHPHIGIAGSQGLHLPVQVVGALRQRKFTENGLICSLSVFIWTYVTVVQYIPSLGSPDQHVCSSSVRCGRWLWRGAGTGERLVRGPPGQMLFLLVVLENSQRSPRPTGHSRWLYLCRYKDNTVNTHINHQIIPSATNSHSIALIVCQQHNQCLSACLITKSHLLFIW